MAATYVFLRIFEGVDPVIGLLAGYLLFRALEIGEAWAPRWRVIGLMLAVWAAVRILDRHDDLHALQWLPRAVPGGGPGS